MRQPLPERQALHTPQLYRITPWPRPGKNLHCCLLLNSHWRGQSAAHALAQAATGFAHGDPTTLVRKGRGSYSPGPQDTQLHLRARWIEGALTDISSTIISRQRSYLMPLALSNTSTPGDNRQPGSFSSHTLPGSASFSQVNKHLRNMPSIQPGATGDISLDTDPKQLLSSLQDIQLGRWALKAAPHTVLPHHHLLPHLHHFPSWYSTTMMCRRETQHGLKKLQQVLLSDFPHFKI